MERQEFLRQVKGLQSHWFHTVLVYEIYFKIWPTNEIVDVFNRHRGFFVPVRNSLYETMMMGLAKVFDRNSRTMSLRRLLEAAKGQMDLVPRLTQKDIEDMEAQLSQHEAATEFLKCIRDQRLAHLDARQQPLPPLQKGQLDSLVATVAEVFNRLSVGHDGSHWDWSFQRMDSAEKTGRILAILQKEMDESKAQLHRRLAELRLDGDGTNQESDDGL